MIRAGFGLFVGLIAGACVGLVLEDLANRSVEFTLVSVCVAGGIISGAIVGGTGDIVEAIKGTTEPRESVDLASLEEANLEQRLDDM